MYVSIVAYVWRTIPGSWELVSCVVVVVVVVVVVFVVVFTLNRSFYPTTSAVPPVSFLILLPRETNYVVRQ